MIRGIDSQIMINKSVDYAKQMADQNNNVQQGKDFVAEMEKARIKKEEESVLHVSDPENARVRREKHEKDKHGGHEAAADRQEEENEGFTAEETAEGKKAEGLGISVDINI